MYDLNGSRHMCINRLAVCVHPSLQPGIHPSVHTYVHICIIYIYMYIHIYMYRCTHELLPAVCVPDSYHILIYVRHRQLKNTLSTNTHTIGVREIHHPTNEARSHRHNTSKGNDHADKVSLCTYCICTYRSIYIYICQYDVTYRYTHIDTHIHIHIYIHFSYTD